MQKFKNLKKFIPALLMSGMAGVLLFSGCTEKNDYNSSSGMIWNTSYHFTFKGAPELADSALAVLDKVGKSLNVFDTTSLVSRVNRNLDTPVDSDFVKVYEMSLRLNSASDGMFDPTLSPLITAWGFGKGHTVTADTAAVDSVLKFVGFSKSRLVGNHIVKDDVRTQFNFSAIAKGYGCDQIGEMLRRNGVSDYLIEIGGEIALNGNGPGKEGWRISIDRPLSDGNDGHESGGVISLSHGGVATSGNYRNFHQSGGKRFGHTISPMTGRPVQTDILSATVIAPGCAEADGAATACMGLGGEKAAKFLSSLGYEGMFVKNDSSVWMTPGFRKMLLSGESSGPGRKGRN